MTLSAYFAHGSGASGYSFWLFTGDPRQYVMATVEELLTRLVNRENEAVQARQRTGLSGTGAGSCSTVFCAVILRNRCVHHATWSHRHAHSWEAEVVLGSDVRMDNMAIHVQGRFACAVHPNMKEVFDLTTWKGADPVNASDITGELQSLSTQL